MWEQAILVSIPSPLIYNFFKGLSEEMYEDGFTNIVNIDISATVVSQMQELYKDKYPNMPYKVMDVK